MKREGGEEERKEVEVAKGATLNAVPDHPIHVAATGQPTPTKIKFMKSS